VASMHVWQLASNEAEMCGRKLKRMAHAISASGSGLASEENEKYRRNVVCDEAAEM